MPAPCDRGGPGEAIGQQDRPMGDIGAAERELFKAVDGDGEGDCSEARKKRAPGVRAMRPPFHGGWILRDGIVVPRVEHQLLDAEAGADVAEGFRDPDARAMLRGRLIEGESCLMGERVLPRPQQEQQPRQAESKDQRSVKVEARGHRRRKRGRPYTACPAGWHRWLCHHQERGLCPRLQPAPPPTLRELLLR